MRRCAHLFACVALGAVCALGCSDTPDGGDDHDDLIRDDLPEQPADAVRMVSPTFDVGSGEEVFMCMRIPHELTEDLWVIQSNAYQVEGGHHSMLFYTVGNTPVREEPHECDETDMGNVRFVGVGTADGGGITLPEGVAFKIPAGAKIFTQSHYLNLADHDIVAQDVVDLRVIPKSEVQEIAGAFTQVDLGLDLPQGEDTTRVLNCTAPMDMKVPWMIPHMHEWGLHFTLEVEIGGERTTVYDSDWDETLRDDFPLSHFTPHLSLTPQDQIITTCTWRNTSGRRLLFPAEMCATFMAFYPSPDGALLACDETGEHFQP